MFNVDIQICLGTAIDKQTIFKQDYYYLDDP